MADKQPFSRLVHPDPATNRIVQDLYDKLAATQQAQSVIITPPTPTTPVEPAPSTHVTTPTFLISSLTAVPSNNPTTGAPYSKDGVVIQFAPLTTDNGVLFRYSEGDFKWHYMVGQFSRTQSQLVTLAAVLNTNHVGVLVDVTDYAHILRWTGSAWEYADPSDPATRIEGFFVDPGTGWHLCDGTSNVAYLKSDGTTTTVTLPNLTSAGANAAYLKFGSPASLTVVAATAPTFTGGAYTPAGTVSAPTFTGTGGTTGSGSANIQNFSAATGVGNLTNNVNVSATHTHTDSGHTHSFTPAGTNSTPTFTGSAGSITGTISTTGEPRNLVLRPFFRV